MFTQRSRNAITVTWKTRHFRLFTFEQNKVGKSEVVEKVIPVADFCRAMRCISAAYAVMRCLSVCLCVCVSVTFVSCVKTNKDIFEIFSPSGGQAILVFPSQTGWRYSDGNPPNGGVECRWSRQKNGILDKYLASLHTSLQCSRPYGSRSVKIKRDERRQASSRALTAASVVRCSHKTTTKCL